MPKSKKADAQVELAPVDDYPEVSNEQRTAEETALAEARFQGDQNPTYHQDFPTLDTSGPEHDPLVQQELIQAGTQPSKEQVKAVVEQYEGDEG